jgi:hypothetical protein
MNAHANKTQENKSRAVANGFSEKQNGNQQTFQFADNRPETIVQRSFQKRVNKSSSLNPVNNLKEGQIQQEQAIQLTRMNQKELVDIYKEEDDFKRTIDMLDGIKTIEVSNLFFKNEDKLEETSSRGLTLPHEKPPVVFINHTKFDSQEVVASTLYHEVHHAYDKDTPPKEDNSEKAVQQDFINEAKTQEIEALRALKKGDKITIDALLKQGKLILKNDKPEVNQDRLKKIVSGDYSNYAKVPREVRFDISSYKFDAVAEFDPGSWSALLK